MKFTGERFIPGICNEELTSEHMNRYWFAASMVKGMRVLDIACGSGYGSMMLHENAVSVDGVDISEEAIAFCREMYQAETLHYHVGSVDAIPLPDGSMDAVVSFETLEHVSAETQLAFMQEIRRVLVPGGLLMISTPNKAIYDERGENDFHVHELAPDDFETLLKQNFRNVEVYGQMSEICNLIVTNHEGNSLVSKGPAVENCEYLVAVCSDGELPAAPRAAMLRLDNPLRKLRAWASENNNRIEELSAWGKSQDKQIAERDATIRELSSENEKLSAWGKSQDAQIAGRDATIRELNSENEKLSAWGKSQDEQIAERDATIRELSNQNEKLSEWGKSQDAQIAERDATIQKLSSENEKLSAWGKSQDVQIAERDETIRKLSSENEKLSEWGKSQDEQIAERDATIQELSSENEKLSEWGKSQDAQIAERDATIQKLSGENEKLSEWGKSQDAQIAERDATIRELSSENEKLSEWGKSQDAQIAERDATIRELNSQNEELSAWGKSQDAQIAERDATIQKLSSENEKLSAWGKSQDVQIAERDETIRKLSSENEKLSEWGKSQDEQIAERDATIQELSSENEKLSEWGKSQDEQIAERDATIRELNRENEKLSEWGKSQDAQIAERDATIRELSSENEKLSEWGKSQDAQIAELDATIRELSNQNEKLSEWGKSQDAQIAERDATIQELSSENEKLSEWGKSQDAQIAERDATIRKLSSHNEELSAWGKSQDEQISKLIKEKELMEREREVLEEQMKNQDEILARMMEKAEQYNGWGSRLEEEIRKANELAETVSTQREALNQLEARYQEEMQCLKELVDSQKAQIQHHKGHIEALEHEVDKRDQQIESQKTEIQYHKGHVEALERVVDTCNDKIKSSQQELNVLRQQVNYLRERERFLSGRDSQLQEIETSRAWRLCRAMQVTSGKLLPPQSAQRKLMGSAVRFMRHPIQTIRKDGQTEAATVSDTQDVIPYGELPMESNNLEDYAPLTFPEWEKPVVSIVIPVYNQFGYTYACLESILRNTADVPYEVIIANDCSTDLTQRISEIVSGIHVVTTEQNLRFLKNCNYAAKHARGEFIFFLNNDTRVLPGWLSSLVELINSDPTIGMVGSKLVFSNGKLQEAGGIVFSDGNCWNYGRNDDPEAPAYNYVKEVDYISGAAIMIRTSLWTKIGGFDEYFCPAYYEDTDLAFAVRKQGFKVVYQPKSVVIHYEGVSNGSDLSSGLKKYQVDNQIKFSKKWKKELKEQTSHDKLELFLARDRSVNKRHLLVVDHYVPTFDKDAGSRNIYLYLKTFVRMGYQVHFIGDNYAHEEPYTSMVQGLGIEVLYGSEMMFGWANWLMEYGRYIGAALLHRPHISIKYIDAVKDMINGPVIYDVADLHRIRLMKEYAINHDPQSLSEAKRMGDMEDYCIKKADIVYSVSVDECTYLNGSTESNKAHPCPIYVYDEFPEITPAEQRKGLLFVGGFGHTPNQDAMRWFLDKIMPIIHKELPDVEINVVGSKVPEDLLKRENSYIHFKGFVSDEALQKLYSQSRMVVIPLRYGAGVKGKTIEAMYYGSAIVSTSTGVEGIENIQEIIQPKDEAHAFAREVISAYKNPKRIYDQGVRNQEYVKKYFSFQRTSEQFIRDFGEPVQNHLEGSN